MKSNANFSKLAFITVLLFSLAALLLSQQTRESKKGYENLTGEQILQAIASSFRTALAKVEPAIVMLEVEREKGNPSLPPEIELKLKSLQSPTENPAYRQRPKAPVTGFVLSKDGYIITSYYNVSDRVKKISVHLKDGRTFAGKLLGIDEINDIAVIKIAADNLYTAKFAKKNLKQGQIIATAGRSPTFELTFNSGTMAQIKDDRKLYSLNLKTNFGNAGAPVFNLAGEIVGIIVQVSADAPHGQNSGLGFAMPISAVLKEAEALKKGISRTKPKKAFLGIKTGVGGTASMSGVLISTVEANTGAAAAGLKPGDLIIGIDGSTISNIEELRKIVKKKRKGDKLTLKIVRNTKTISVKVTLKADGLLGITVSPKGTALRSGVLIAAVLPNTGAAAAGLKPGDLITSADDSSISNLDELRRILKGKHPGDVLTLEIIRGTKTKTIKVILTAKPANYKD